MIANNIWKLIGDMIEWAFAPYDALRLGTDNWWSSNIVSWALIVVGLISLIYWMGQMYRYKRSGKEDSA